MSKTYPRMLPNPGLHANANSIETAAGPRGRGASESGAWRKELVGHHVSTLPGPVYIRSARSRAAGFQGLAAVALCKFQHGSLQDAGYNGRPKDGTPGQSTFATGGHS